MSETRIVPLACSRCGSDLLGRSVDRLAFCAACEIAYRVDTPSLKEVRVVGISRSRTEEGSVFHLPFWGIDDLIIPAFISSRPLTLTRVATRLHRQWSSREGFETPVPLGARIAPENLVPVGKMLSHNGLAHPESAWLLSVPVRAYDRRLWLPGDDFALYPDDVIDSGDLLRVSQTEVCVGE